MLRRATQRWYLTLAITLVMAAVVGVRHSRKARLFESQVVMSVHETSLKTMAAPAIAGQLRSYILQVIMNNSALLKVMKEHHHLQDTVGLDPALALAEMRENILLRVTDDFYTREAGQEIRTAKIIVGYRAPDPEVALRIARALGDLVTAGQTDSRQSAAHAALSAVSKTASRLSDELLQARSEARQVEQSYLSAPPEEQLVLAARLKTALGAVRSLEEQMALVQTGASRLKLSSDFEGGAVGLRYDVLDPGRLAPMPKLSRQQEAIVVALVILILAMPVSGIAVATFDWRVRDLEGLTPLGLKPFAQIPTFGGSELGSFSQRATTDRRRA